jgi:hypothetical protein
MIQTGFDARVKVQQIIENQLPEFILDESPKTSEFLKQYYISQEYQGGPTDIAENLDQYLKLDNLLPEVIVGVTSLSNSISSSSGIVTVTSTKGFPPAYGLLKIDNEIITYTGITTNTFTGCIRGFSGITSYYDDSSQNQLVFTETQSASHTAKTEVTNLSSLFLKEFYKKLKFSLAPGLEDYEFVPELKVGNFIKQAKDFYKSKGTNESFRILFSILYGVKPKVIDLESFLFKPSASNFIRRQVIVVERISGDPNKLVGQTIRKSTDYNTNASVSEVETISRNNKLYYKISLYVGFNESDEIQGNFVITPKTKVVENVSIGSSFISVDSTIGFPESGVLYSGDNEITYVEKTINQFLGCSNITSTITSTSDIRSDETYYGYEDGNLNKKVEFRITGVLNRFTNLNNVSLCKEGEEILLSEIGKKIPNPETNKTFKEKLANSWIYNTSSRYYVSYSSGSFTSKTNIDPSTLKSGDQIEVLKRGTNIVVSSPTTIATVTGISGLVINVANLLDLNDQAFDPTDPTKSYYGSELDIRRKLKKAKSTGTDIRYGNNIICDIQNVYDDNNGYLYVASNSLPSYTITKNVFEIIIPEANSTYIQDKNNNTQKYSTIVFDFSSGSENYSKGFTQVPFLTGDKIYYRPTSNPIPGLQEGEYYVKVVSSNSIKLYPSLSFLPTDNYFEFEIPQISIGKQSFILAVQKNKHISPQKILRKFPTEGQNSFAIGNETIPGSVGMLLNGVEICNYKSTDKIYSGPLDYVKVVNQGEDYDVINPPAITVSSGIGSTAYIQPVLQGSLKKIYIDPQDFDLDIVVSAAVSGGNGSGAVLQPVIEKRSRTIYFDGRITTNYGGIDITNDTITFKTIHNFKNGEEIIYHKNGNPAIGIGTYLGSNTNTGNYLQEQKSYFAKIINSRTVQLYPSLLEYNSGINTVGFTTINTNGTHFFTTINTKNTLTSIKVIDGGSGYTNRKLIVNPSGILTTNHTVNFPNHGFSSGELIKYNYETAPISGLNSSFYYQVLVNDSNSFRIVNAGIGGTNTSDYARQKYIKFESKGTGYQYFSYPEINLNIRYSIGINSAPVGIITATPVVRGSIIDAYLYEKGTNYGSSILNLHKKPEISIDSGEGAELRPLILNGSIYAVQIQYGGKNYYSDPDLEVTGEGSGAILRAVRRNKKIVDVVIINGGVGYSQESTIIKVKSTGKKAFIDIGVRSLTVNNNYRFGSEVLVGSDSLQYCVSGYFDSVRSTFNDTSDLTGTHSPLIGWAYDGNPIYGSYGYVDPQNVDGSGVTKLLTPGYTINPGAVYDRPKDFASGFFIDDYIFTNSGDLDSSNGRFGKTPEFPNGTYAYFAGITTSGASLQPVFPYFVGNKFRNSFIDDNKNLDQSFDFNNSDLIRNTLPYNVNEEYADNDFLVESTEIINQKTIVDSAEKGTIEDFTILDVGSKYKVGDVLNFSDNTSGSGLNAEVYSVKGNNISKITTTVQNYNNSILTWQDGKTVKVTILPYHDLLNDDLVTITGVSTNLSYINGSYKIGVTSFRASLAKDIPSNNIAGIITDIYVSNIPSEVSIGSSIKISGEIFGIRDILRGRGSLRVLRSVSGTAYTATTNVEYLPDSFIVSVNANSFESYVNKKVFFNPVETVGLGTLVGVGTTVRYTFDGLNYIGIGTTATSPLIRSIETRTIFFDQGHPFVDNQEVLFTKPTGIGATALKVSKTGVGETFFLPDPSSDSQVVYISNRSKNSIGIKTTRSSDPLFFIVDAGTNRFDYSITSLYSQNLSQVQKVGSTVSISTTHNLKIGDLIDLNIKPNITVGIGTSGSINVKYDLSNEKLLVNPIGFSSYVVSNVTNTINLQGHNLQTGDKVSYRANLVASGLATGSYYVYKVDDNNISLCETHYDSVKYPPTIVSIAGTGGSSQEIALINPKIVVTKNNNLKFNLSDSSLSGYKFKLFTDTDFKNEFISIGNTGNFSITGIGSIGISTNASVTVSYFEGMPPILYYTLEKGGFISTADKDVNYYSQITFIDSLYNGVRPVSGVGSTSFTILLKGSPERLEYLNTDCETITYTTTSNTESGGIDKIKVLSRGLNYDKLPIVTSITSTNGSGAYIIPKSDSVGRIKDVRIINEGFEYSCDKTLRPTAKVASVIFIKSSNKIVSVKPTYGGSNYTSKPSLVVFNPETKSLAEDYLLDPILSSSGITRVDVVKSPQGLPSETCKIYATNNSNGVTISTMESSQIGIVTCYLTTPVLGFGTDVLKVGDEIFVEGIKKDGTSGTGFNSTDYEYKFFTVTNYQNTIPAKVEFSLSSLTTNPGVAKTVQDSFASIIKKTNYPEFEVIQEQSPFILGEQLETNTGSGFINRDLVVTEYDSITLKLIGSYQLSVGEKVRGVVSGSTASITKIDNRLGRFETEYSTRSNYSWNDKVGVLDDDGQSLSDNDYFQNLSYTIKSPITFDKSITAVNSLVHSSGLKNFSDTEVISSTRTGIGSTDGSSIIYDILNENRVDTINNLDFGLDVNTENSKSKFVKLKNRKLSNYIQCNTNRVLQLDDIANLFTNNDAPAVGYADLTTYQLPDNFSTFLIQIANTSKSRFQIEDLVILVDQDYNVFTLQRATVNDNIIRVADIDGYVDDTLLTISLRFDPLDPYNEDYDIKCIKSGFPNNSIGIGSTSVGLVKLTGSSSYVSPGVTTSVVSIATTENYRAFHGTIQVMDTVTNDMDYVELYAIYDGQDTYMSQYFYDTSSLTNNFSNNYIGTFSSSVSSGILSLTFNNDSPHTVVVNSKFVGFGPSSVGIGTFRFQVPGQLDGLERSAKYETKYATTLSNGVVGFGTTIISYIKTEVAAFKAKVQLSVGSSSELHQLLYLSNGDETFLTQYPILSIGSTSGIGTFGANTDITTNSLIFYPNSNLGSGIVEIKSFAEVFYLDADYLNEPPNLNYGTLQEEFSLTPYNGLNARRINKLDFDANYQGIPIFEKSFNPSNPIQFNPVTGTFTIPDHFFQTAEELIYKPDTTFLGTGVTAVGIGATLSYTGVVTDFLPPRVYPIKLDNSNFKLATRREYAQAGIYVTFTSFGLGNSHKLEMTKKLERSLLTIDSVVQAPISYSLLNYQLKYNTNSVVGYSSAIDPTYSIRQYSPWADTVFSQEIDNFLTISSPQEVGTKYGIGAGNTLFSVSGISSMKPGDLLKIDDEFVKVISVGLGTTSGSPISGLGTYYVLETQRGYAGTAATIHVNDSPIQLYRGSYNIVGNKIWFTEAPRGNAVTVRDTSNLEQPKSSFTGRVFLRKDYTTNTLYDNISETFTGIGQTYILTLNGFNTTGIGSTGGNGIVFINSIFQTPSTKNNTGNNFNVVDNAVLGITSIVFSGITSTNGDIVKSLSDVTQNQLPRGGLIVSLGSSLGRGYAPLVGVGSTAIEIKLTGGSISSIGFSTNFVVGVAVTGAIGVTTNSITGILTNSISVGQEILAIGVVTNGTYITSIGIGSITINSNSTNSVGIATTFTFRSETVFGSGYFGNVSIGISDSTGSGAVILGRVGAGGSIAGFVIQNGGTGYTNPYAQVAPPSYENLPIIGISRLSTGSTTDTGVGLAMNVTVGPSLADITPISGRNADASNLILANKQLIAEVAVGRMLAAYPSFSIPGGNQNCIEDVVTVLECICYNLKYGGNSRVYDAAKIYIDNNYLAGEEEQSIYAFVEARNMAIQAMRNQTITIDSYSSLTQYFDFTIEGDISGIPGVYQTGCDPTDFTGSCDCSDVASAISSFVGIVTYAIGTDTLVITRTGVAATIYDVESFKITRPGYGFQRGDVFKPVGLVTAKGLSAPLEEFKLTVLDTFTDSFAAWQFGEMDYIDSIKSLQDGNRTRFPLYYNSQLLSFETDPNNQDSAAIDLGPVLLIFVNGIVQAHGDTYQFDGGSSFTFKDPPLPEDNIAIFFYRGSRDVDSALVTVKETIKKGDTIQLFKSPLVTGVGIVSTTTPGITTTQDPRIVIDLSSSDKLETGTYTGYGIDEKYSKPLSWTKQKIDRILNGEIVSKSRDAIETQVYPTAKIIKSVNIYDQEIFVDDAKFFNYEEDTTAAYVSPLLPITINSVNLTMFFDKVDPVSAAMTATVSAAGTISALTITNPGSGYTGTTLSIGIARPKTIGVGIGSTAFGTVSISNGSITSPVITFPGFGYTTAPRVIVPYPAPIYEKMTGASLVQGFSGIITGIGTTSGSGANPLALKFFLNVTSPNSFPSGLSTGYPIYIYDTTVGSGVTSIEGGDTAVVGVGTTYLNNIYIIKSISYSAIGATNAVIECNVLSTTNITGIGTTTGQFAGRFSWGRISGISRGTNPVSIGITGLTVDSGLSTFPVIQRRGYGLRDIGALKKDLG